MLIRILPSVAPGRCRASMKCTRWHGAAVRRRSLNHHRRCQEPCRRCAEPGRIVERDDRRRCARPEPWERLRGGLLVAESRARSMLLVGAGLLGRSWASVECRWRLRQRVLTATVLLPAAHGAQPRPATRLLDHRPPARLAWRGGDRRRQRRPWRCRRRFAYSRWNATPTRQADHRAGTGVVGHAISRGSRHPREERLLFTDADVDAPIGPIIVNEEFVRRWNDGKPVVGRRYGRVGPKDHAQKWWA